MMVTVSFCPLWFTMVTPYPLSPKKTRLGTLRTVVSFAKVAVVPLPAAVKFPTTAPAIVN